MGGPGAATDLEADAACTETAARTWSATLTWSVASPPGSEQRVAITTHKNGFERADAELIGPLPPDQNSLLLEQRQAQGNHYWRVLTLHDNGWVASDTALFVGPTCAADFQPEDP